jgi:hypothetical protein
LVFTASALDNGIDTTAQGNVAAYHYSSTAAQLQVEFIYSPIPEPATYAVMLGALTLMVIEVRQRFARRVG